MDRLEDVKAKTTVDVVVVNYNAGPYIIDLVGLLKNSPTLNLHVVDNGSTDGSLQSLQQIEIGLSVNKDNSGFAVACNQGAQQGKAPVIAFVNPDCLLEAGQIERLVAELENSENALMGCHVVDPDGTTQRGTWRRLPNLWRVLVTASGLERLSFIQGLNLTRAPKPVEAVNGACFVIKRRVYEQLSGFDENYPLHFEDLDLFKRVQNIGCQLGYDSDMKVKHIKGHSSTDNQQVKTWKKQGMLRYFKKHRPAWEHRIIRLLVGLK